MTVRTCHFISSPFPHARGNGKQEEARFCEPEPCWGSRAVTGHSGLENSPVQQIFRTGCLELFFGVGGHSWSWVWGPDQEVPLEADSHTR